MVGTRLAFIKHLALAIVSLAVGVAGVEFVLHLHDAYCCDEAAGEQSVCAPSWTVHHLLRPCSKIAATNPDSGADVSWRTNSLGLRGPEIEIPKPASTYRILCLGDESTLAPDTADRDTFCAQLQQKLRTVSPVEIEVINAGCPQYGPLLSLLRLRQALLALNPDLIVYHFDMSDIVDDHRVRGYVRMSGSQALYCSHPDLERQRGGRQRSGLERLLMWRQCKRGFCCLLSSGESAEDVRDIDSPRGTYGWLRDEAPDWSVYVEQTLDVLGQLSLLCRRANIDFVLAAVPAPWQISAEASTGPRVRALAGLDDHVLYGSRAPFETLADFAEKNDVRYCDASPAFGRAERPERLYLNNAPRFSATGHELYARILGGFVVRNVAGPWSSSRSPRNGGRQNLTQGGSGRRVLTRGVDQSVGPKTVTRTSAPGQADGRVHRAEEDEHEHDAHQGDFEYHPSGWGAAR